MGLIADSRGLKKRFGPLRPWLNFRAGSFFSPDAICYSSRYSRIPENEARFALLHEEGHFIIRQNSRPLHLAYAAALRLSVLAVLIFLVTTVLVLIDVDVDLSIVPTIVKADVAIVMVLAAFAVSFRALRQRELELDEDNSDDFAAERMALHFDARTPSHILDSLLARLQKKKSTSTNRDSPILRSVGLDVHRPRKERVDRIANKYDHETLGDC